MFISKRNFKNKKAGFTLVELLVTISIFTILTGVVLFNQAKFNSTILLTNLAYDTALTIRQAQTYGINIKNFTTVSGSDVVDNFTPYGVHFDMGSTTSFILFSDLSGAGNGSAFPDSGDISVCRIDDGCVNRYNIQRGNKISGICVYNAQEIENCNIQKLDIIFVRPNPDAKIMADGALYNKAVIKLNNSDDTNTREVFVQTNGLIYISKIESK